MLSVDIEKIIPVTSARDMFNKIVDEVEGSDELYVLTKNGKPAAVVVGVNHLEKLTGETSGEIMTKVDQATEEPKDDAEEPAKPFDTSAVTPPADKPAITPATTPSTDFSATPATPSSAMPTSDFNTVPAMPEPASAAIPDPMAPVTDADGKEDTSTPAAPASTPTSDPFASPATPNTGTSGNSSPTPSAAGDTNATPPAANN